MKRGSLHHFYGYNAAAEHVSREYSTMTIGVYVLLAGMAIALIYVGWCLRNEDLREWEDYPWLDDEDEARRR